MAHSRAELQTVLEELLGSDEVHYQAPNNVQMTYPAIVYSRQYGVVNYADNRPYQKAKRWLVVVIDRNPDMPAADLVEELPYCSFDREYKVGNLNHKAFNLYF